MVGSVLAGGCLRAGWGLGVLVGGVVVCHGWWFGVLVGECVFFGDWMHSDIGGWVLVSGLVLWLLV